MHRISPDSAGRRSAQGWGNWDTSEGSSRSTRAAATARLPSPAPARGSRAWVPRVSPTLGSRAWGGAWGGGPAAAAAHLEGGVAVVDGAEAVGIRHDLRCRHLGQAPPWESSSGVRAGLLEPRQNSSCADGASGARHVGVSARGHLARPVLVPWGCTSRLVSRRKKTSYR